MALDGIVINQITKEILTSAYGAKVSKISQPSGDMIIIHMRANGENLKLLISINPSNARISFTKTELENPINPPMFCMLMRKHLLGSRLTAINQQGLDRVVFIDFVGYNDIGDKETTTLVVELMGRRSNFIILKNGAIVDALHKTDLDVANGRTILPKFPYNPPPSQNKKNIISTNVSEIADDIKSLKNIHLSDAVLAVIEGFSPLPAREFSHLLSENDQSVETLDTQQFENLSKILADQKEKITSGKTTPTLLVEKSGRPKDFSFMKITQYGDMFESRDFFSYSEMLDFFYEKRDISEKVGQSSHTLEKLVSSLSKRIAKRIAIQTAELEQANGKENFKMTGDLLSSYIYQLKKGQTSVCVKNYYDNNNDIEIKLDGRKSPSQNIQNYYNKYRKLANAQLKLTQLLEAGHQELLYVEAVLDSIRRAQSEKDLEEIRQELTSSGYIKEKRKIHKKLEKPRTPQAYISSDGFKIFVGRNNIQNEKLTLKDSRGEDVWFHAKDIPGAHVVVISEGRSLSDNTIVEAATLAAYNSSGSASGKLPVDYTEIKNVKKLSKTGPGMVKYENQKTITVEINIDTIDKLENLTLK